MSRRPKESEVSFLGQCGRDSTVQVLIVRFGWTAVGPVWASRCPHGSRHESGYEVTPKYVKADWFGTRWTGLGIQVSAWVSTRVLGRTCSEVFRGRLVRNPLDRFGHPGVRTDLDTSPGTKLVRSRRNLVRNLLGWFCYPGPGSDFETS
jgi:hypothetical protein